mgnify:CR=1 FL=1
MEAEQADHEIGRDNERSAQHDQADGRQADPQHVDPGVVGDPGANARDLAVDLVDDERAHMTSRAGACGAITCLVLIGLHVGDPLLDSVVGGARLHADHEQNASTSTVRLAGSTGANPYACIAAGIAALWGPAHGGANEAVLKMLDEIGSVENVADFMEKVKTKEVKLMGFGHRVYKNFDPRAKVMKQTCDEVLAALNINDPQLALAMELERIALNDPYFVERKLYPNVDFYSGIILKAIGIPTSMFTVIFALARTVGWISHWLEMHSASYKIGRPRQLYTGYTQRNFVEVDKR